MKLFTAALLSLAALHQLADAWTIKSSQAESSPVGGHEAVSKTWTVSGSEALTSLQLRGFGRVFVSHDESFVGSGNAAKVVFSGSDASLLDVLEVSNGKGQGIQIHVKNEDYEGKGYLITRVYVAKKESIHSVDLVSSNDVYVSDGVVAQHSDSVKLSVTGSGDLYAGSGGDSWSVGKIDASVTGSGDIQLHANSLDVKDSLLLTVAGSGDIGVFADEARISNQLRTNVPGSGDVHVQSSNLEVNHLTTSVSGSGDVTYSNKGSCQKQEISVYGSGDVSAGSIVCVDTKVDVYGSGDVLVQTTGNLVVSAPTSGDVKYYGATPSHIETDDYSRFHHKKHESVKHATRNSYHEYRPKSLPEPSARYIALKTESSYFSDEPRIRYEYESDYYNEALVKNFITNQEHQNGFNLHVQDFAANTARHAPGFATLAVVGGALVVVGVAAKKFQARRERKEYQPLV